MRKLSRLKPPDKKKKIHYHALGKFRREINRLKGSSVKHRSKSCLVRPVYVRGLYPGHKLGKYLKRVI